ncbi:hypothetical protein B0J11DRAFT_531457 [Dendryphion nanum]|uniref:Uncharacterized protein n=1 Tax=Dendryphion nanum TaxID=256645 RepID=A0A9P9IK70_9PLEO|nr:hypothetical protein B0J11DRAFT_531457 [Dendryphion nanum]
MPRPPPASPSPPPTAFNFTYMSGNFDYPNASSSPPPPSRGLAAIDQYPSYYVERRHLTDRSSPPADNEHATSMPPRRPRVVRQFRRPLMEDLERHDRDSDSLRPPLPASLNAARPRATPSERYLRRSHARLREQRFSDLHPSTSMSISSDDFPNRNPFLAATSALRARSPPADPEASRRTKRRKLDHEHTRASPYDGFRYGYKGQVVTGRLKMEIVSCDGGEYEKHGPSGLSYPIQNVLKNDTSVYCSERSRCNLLLKHIGEMPFTLEKVVIRAPDRGFTAPVQEGLIFVSMSSNHLINSTSSYQIEYGHSSARTSPAPSSHAEPQFSLREALDDPSIWENSRQGLQEAMEEQIERLRLRGRRSEYATTARARHERRNAGQEDDEDSYVDHCDFPTEDYAHPAGVSAPTPPPFTISTETETESDSNEELPSPAIMADRLRRESRWRPESDEEGDEHAYRYPPLRRAYNLSSLDDNFTEQRRRIPDRYPGETAREPLRASRLRTPSRIEPKESMTESDSLITPHAKFFIAKHKNKITIKFHPAVSGKFILLKLWSPTQDGNIDIESVQFHGYSGPRFFPSSQPC